MEVTPDNAAEDAADATTRYRPTTSVGPSPENIAPARRADADEMEDDPNLDPLDPTDPLRPGQVGDTTPDLYRETDVNMGRHPQGQSPAPPMETTRDPAGAGGDFGPSGDDGDGRLQMVEAGDDGYEAGASSG